MFNPGFKDMLLALSDARIDFLLVGADAIAAHTTLHQQHVRRTMFLRKATASSPESRLVCSVAHFVDVL